MDQLLLASLRNGFQSNVILSAASTCDWGVAYWMEWLQPKESPGRRLLNGLIEVEAPFCSVPVSSPSTNVTINDSTGSSSVSSLGVTTDGQVHRDGFVEVLGATIGDGA